MPHDRLFLESGDGYNEYRLEKDSLQLARPKN